MSAITHFNLENTFVALNDSGGARPLLVTDDFWNALQEGRLGAFSRLVSFLTFERDWETWEKHPAGEEVVCLLEGEVELLLDQDGDITTITLNQAGTFVLVPTNTWHTASVKKLSKLLFITPGEGTEIKARIRG